jgi:hypothetical protein
MYLLLIKTILFFKKSINNKRVKGGEELIKAIKTS